MHPKEGEVGIQKQGHIKFSGFDENIYFLLYKKFFFQRLSVCLGCLIRAQGFVCKVQFG
jgi:hypothetical protein